MAAQDTGAAPAIVDGLPLATVVRVLRDRRLLTQEELAQSCGISVGTVRGLEAGRVARPRSTTLRLLAAALCQTDREREVLVAAARYASADADRGRHDHPHAVPSQLPPTIADFTGRDRDVAWLEDTLLIDDAAPRAVAIAVVAGRGGAGKTALVTHVAQRAARRYPDGQLHVNLRGAEADPLDPGRALSRFLRALGVEEHAIPDDLEERAALYRDRIAGRSCLVLLDDAASEAQVRPLLPGSASCAVLVSSRHRLSGLEGARHLVLDVFTPAEAVALLARIAGQQRVAAEPRAAHQIVGLCGYLPLAVRIVGARLSSRPHWRLADLAERMSDDQRRLDELAAGDLEVRASIGLSYAGLGDMARRAFRLLGLLRAPDFAAWVVAALVDATVDEAADIVEDLAAAHLVEVVGTDPTGQTRFRLHDLVRLFAHERAVHEVPDRARRAALTRALGAWLAVAEQADDRLPSREHRRVRGDAPRWRGGAGVAGSVLGEPLAWYEAERVALVMAVEQACALGLDELAWELAASSYGYFDRRGLLEDWENTHMAALVACRAAHNLRGRAVMARNLAGLCEQRGRDRLLPCADEAIAASRALGDRRLEADACIQWGVLHRNHDPRAGQARVREGMAIADDEDHVLGAIRGRLWLGVMHRESGDHAAAAGFAAGCVDLARRHGHPDQQLEALRLLGASYRALGSDDPAHEALLQALQIAHALGNHSDETRVLATLGELYVHCGRADARAVLERSLALASVSGDEFGQALALRILAELDLSEHRHDDAYARLTRALEHNREAGFAYGEALILRALGACHAARGDAGAARSAWTAAQRLFAGLGNTAAADALAERITGPQRAGAAAPVRRPPT